ncbi:class I SAM-dependent methyltransferase [Pseudoalteromonas sp. KG3]|uniref:class I SAM-dependent methyltransferase n=1 Tax=Pseudoalteromonas sp. KG3 TaxID=2951137 RepID=UPI0026595EC1|nr:class I SAM-dependent methyltransferase [Pseudoalteromonas sp. KG3]WKD24685.1 class I SAM-dependent methyltransferase [Pseudoalteromonas sp. KG3]
MSEFNSKQAEWDQIARDNHDFKAQVGRPFEDELWQALTDDVEKKLSFSVKGNNVLDVGCGNGLLLSKLLSNCTGCSGVDYSEVMIEEAKKLLPMGCFYQSEANNLPFEKHQFDRVLSYSIFHYFPSYDYALSVIKEMIRVCKPGGVILIGDVLDSQFEKEIKATSNLEYEKTIPLIHRYSKWRFFSFEQLKSDLEGAVRNVEILSQPSTFPLSQYRKDMRLWI